MVTQAALITLVCLINKFQDTGNFKLALYWFLQASRFGRYSGSSATSLEEDLRDIAESATFDAALERLTKRIRIQPLTCEDFLRDYGDTRFGRFLLYLMVYKNGALDWDEQGHRLGFQGLDILEDFKPQWHHVFPRKYLEKKVEERELIDALSNIAVIGPAANIRISAKDPMSYITKYNITPQKLSQQFISTEIGTISTEQYPEWVKGRAQLLADRANAFLDELAAG